MASTMTREAQEELAMLERVDAQLDAQRFADWEARHPEFMEEVRRQQAANRARLATMTEAEADEWQREVDDWYDTLADIAANY